MWHGDAAGADAESVSVHPPPTHTLLSSFVFTSSYTVGVRASLVVSRLSAAVRPSVRRSQYCSV